ncbi:GNAT family N-acetyltransferase [Natronococcus sp. A-GB1]|uniref:GNAT family N-acetyltransferase n=1 Tax=Natronococcus sp. A-GB1 TaxID=3037648 RepID=UPI00241C57F6|nr:GNAT family N-acetyltransferase [Natronococcus sp. A-GB1]MDG5759563.1 GNAT family N-acetyltransferase [Natronococcus sp. A-GB1]
MTPDSPVVEPATQGDLPAITELWVRLARDQRDHGSFVRDEENRETMRETLAGHLHTDGLLVARDGESIVGFVTYSLERGSLELDATRGLLSNIYVAAAYRDRGVGTALLEAAEDALADRGAEVVILEVLSDNETARRFYEDRAYEPYRVSMRRSLEDRSENDTHSKEER